MQTQTYAYNKILAVVLSLVVLAIVSVMLPFGVKADSNSINAWWPKDGSHVTGSQPFKAQVSGLDTAQYEMFWQVDGGTWNWMSNSNTDYPHKEAVVDVSSWNWHGSGPYKVNFIARQNGNIIAQQAETIYIDNGQPIVLPQPASAQTAAVVPAAATIQPTQQVTVSAPAPMIVVPTQTTSKTATTITASAMISANTVQTSQTAQASAFASASATSQSGNLYVDTSSNAYTQEMSAGGGDASALQMLASQPTAAWFGNWNSNIYNDVHSVVAAAAAKGATPVLVAYNIPERDCGGFSSGGSNNPAGYQSWIGSFASAIGNNKAIVILEPDALAEINCLSGSDQTTRLSLLWGAVSALKANGNTKVYLDAGHSNWIDAGTMASNLQKANISQADGFALNVSNFMPTSGEVSYGQQISSKLNGKHFVVDTSRNGGSVSSGEWCNPWGAAIGQKPTTQTGNTAVDAFLWIKTPGESDGNCNGGPGAGTWWQSYAVSLVKNAHN